MAEQPPADQSENKAIADAPPPLTLEQIKAAVKERHSAARLAVIRGRAEREKLNRRIKAALAEEAEAARILRSLEPRKTNKAAK